MLKKLLFDEQLQSYTKKDTPRVVTIPDKQVLGVQVKNTLLMNVIFV